MPDDQEDPRPHTVVINHDEQYSIWAVGRDVPAGWIEIGVRGSKAECLDHIEQAWVDMRPLRVRWQLEQLARMEGANP